MSPISPEKRTMPKNVKQVGNVLQAFVRVPLVELYILYIKGIDK